MNAEIISVGTELLLGQVVNLDTAIVAQELSGLGINLLYSAWWGTMWSACAMRWRRPSPAAAC